MDCTFRTPEGVFNYRVAAILRRGEWFLAMRGKPLNHWYLPGGRVKLHVPLEDALCREMEEELSLPARIVRPLWLCENFYTMDTQEAKDVPFHELCLYYLAEVPESGLPEGETFSRRDSDGVVHQYRWFSREDLEREQVYPSFLGEEWPVLPEHIELRTLWD